VSWHIFRTNFNKIGSLSNPFSPSLEAIKRRILLPLFLFENGFLREGISWTSGIISETVNYRSTVFTISSSTISQFSSSYINKISATYLIIEGVII